MRRGGDAPRLCSEHERASYGSTIDLRADSRAADQGGGAIFPRLLTESPDPLGARSAGGGAASDGAAALLSFTLFGRFGAGGPAAGVGPFQGRKLQELLSYLLIFRNRPHRRELVADALWGASEPLQSRKYLRQALWELHAVLPGDRSADAMLLVDSNWIQLNPSAAIWVDVEELESAFAAARGVRGEDLDASSATRLSRAVQLYRADLLEGWYQEWCLFERERLRSMYLLVAEKLLAFHERHGQLEEGFDCAERILRQDGAHERTHRRLMRLRYLAGDRTGAMRQYQTCRAALRDELDVDPSDLTSGLYELIRADSGAASVASINADLSTQAMPANGLDSAVEPLEQALAALTRAERLVAAGLRALRPAGSPADADPSAAIDGPTDAGETARQTPRL